MTKRELFETLLALEVVKENADLVEGLNHEIELLNRKNTGSKKASKITEEIKVAVYDALQDYDEPVTIKQLIEDNFKDSGYTSQKLVPVLKALAEDNLVERISDKRTAKFKVIA